MLSHHHKTIFVHIPKTAGQSIEMSFLASFGLGWKDRAPLLLRPCDDTSFGPKRLAHLFAEEYVKLGHIFAVDFDAYFKFSIVRHPIDRIRSSYLASNPPSSVSIKDYVKAGLASDKFTDRYRHVAPQVEFLCDSAGKLMVDEVGRFENLQNFTSRIFKKCDLDMPQLPHVNETKLKLFDEKTGLNEKTKAWLKDIYAEDFERFDYAR